jgi:ribose transport system ATP-binding protein
MLLALPLAAVAAAEFVAMFTGGIDVSVGATMGVTVAVMSFAVQSGGVITSLLISAGLAVGIGLAVGTTNGLLVEKVRISPVIATIATLGILQGVGLLLRPKAAGTISQHLTDALTKQTWIFPIALLVVAALFVLSDIFLRRSGYGLRLRAVGLNPQFAYRLGVNAPRFRQVSYLGCAILAAFAGVLLAGQVGVGDSTVGNQYTLLAIAAPILGGASLLGGRGTFVGCLLGAVLLAMAQTLPTVLSLSDGASFLLTGGLTLLALLIYTRGASAAVRTYARTVWRKLGPGQPSAVGRTG